MKRKIILIFASFIFLTTLGKASQEVAPFGSGVGIFGGYSTYSDQYHGGSASFGLSFTLGITKNITIELAGVRAESSITGSTAGLDTGKFTTMPVQLSFQFRFPVSGRVVPFVLVGGGYYINTYKIDPGLASSWENLGFSIDEKVKNSMGGQFGAGLDFFVSKKISLGARISYSLSSTKGTWSMTETDTGIVTSGTIDSIKFNSLFFGISVRYVFK